LWTATCPISGAVYHPPAVSSSAFPVFVYLKFMWRSASCPSPLLRCAYSTPPPLLGVSFQFLVYCSFFFLWGGGVILSRVLWWFIPGMAMGVPHVTCLLTCWSSSPKQVWSLQLAAAAALLFSQCNMVWRSFVRARSSGC
jgi:hypothetical protein